MKRVASNGEGAGSGVNKGARLFLAFDRLLSRIERAGEHVGQVLWLITNY